MPNKNIKLLNGHPLIAYTIAAARQSQCFEKILVSSDETKTLDIASDYGADCIRRPDEFATDTSPDIEWLTHALRAVRKTTAFDTFSILRPTSPFRQAVTIQRAFAEWGVVHAAGEHYTSLRAVEKVSQHAGKMWRVHEKELVPLLLQPSGTPMHDSQAASLPDLWVQNASLEIAWTSTVEQTGTISGRRVLAFFTGHPEGFDINRPDDWVLAETMLRDGSASLPYVSSSEDA